MDITLSKYYHQKFFFIFLKIMMDTILSKKYE